MKTSKHNFDYWQVTMATTERYMTRDQKNFVIDKPQGQRLRGYQWQNPND